MNIHESLNTMDPILRNLPMPIKTNRLTLRPPCAGDGKKLNDAIIESFDELHPWMPWAAEKSPIEVTEVFVRQASAEWIMRTNLNVIIWNKEETTIIGGTGYNEIQWHIPSVHIGYWVRTSCAGQGYISEAVNALVHYAFKELKVARVAISCDEDNLKSRKVAERLNFTLEGNLKSADRKINGELRNTCIYARYNAENLPDVGACW